MSLFGKKKNEKEEETSCCCCGEKAVSSSVTTCCDKAINGIRCIKVLGSGCKACHQLYDNAVRAAEGMGIEVEYITDLQKIMEYGAMSMPALVVNDTLVSSGKTLKPAEISELINRFKNN